MLSYGKTNETISRTRIVFVVESIFTKRDCDRFYINELIQHEFEVLIIDLTELIYAKSGNLLNIKSIDSNYTKCKSIKEFCEAINQFKPIFSVNIVNRSKNNYFIRLFIAFYLKRKSRLIEHYCVNLPLEDSFFSIKEVFKTILFFPWIFLRPHYNIVTNKNSMKYARGRLVKLHEYDYELYLKSSRKSIEKLTNPYLLFLDEGGAFHPDFIYQNIKCSLTPEIYYPEINKTLLDLAHNLKLKPFVQLHPKVNGDNIKEFFQVSISECSTIDAIRNASLIVAHSSTAIQIAVLFQKPIILLKTTQLLEFKKSKLLIKNFTKHLNCPCIWPHEAKEILSIPKVNIKAYLAYQNHFTKISNTPNKLNSEIFIDFLINENKKISTRVR